MLLALRPLLKPLISRRKEKLSKSVITNQCNNEYIKKRQDLEQLNLEIESENHIT